MLRLLQPSRKRNLGLCRIGARHSFGAMTTGNEWQGRVGHAWAQMHERTDRSFAGLTERLLARIAALAGSKVLDIGCGAGELALAIARARPRAEVLGVDVSGDLVTAARERAGPHPRVRFAVADAAQWSDPDFAPNLLVSRHGVMFFDDPPAAFENLRRASAPSARLAFSCFRPARDNPWALGIAELFDLPPAAPDAPGPFAFADPRRVEAILTAGGWEGIDFAPIDFAYVAGAGADPVAEALALFTRIGPSARALFDAPEADRAAMRERLGEWLETQRNGDLVAFPAAAWVVTAERRGRTTRPR